MNKQCPKCNHLVLIENSDSILFGKNYYCPRCDAIFVEELKELSKSWFEKNFNSDRFDDIRQLSLIKEARKHVTKEQLLKLGLLTTPTKTDKTTEV